MTIFLKIIFSGQNQQFSQIIFFDLNHQIFINILLIKKSLINTKYSMDKIKYK